MRGDQGFRIGRQTTDVAHVQKPGVEGRVPELDATGAGGGPREFGLPGFADHVRAAQAAAHVSSNMPRRTSDNRPGLTCP